MRKAIVFLVLSAICSLSLNAQRVVIKRSDFVDAKRVIRAGHPIFPDSLVFSSDAEEIHVPDVGAWYANLGNYHFPNLKKITFGNVELFNSFSFENMPKLEEIEFTGMVGVGASRLIKSCPNLRKVTFKGPVSSTGGSTFAIDCPNLDTVIFESVVCLFYYDISPEDNCPKLKNYINHGAFLYVKNENLTPKATIEQLASNPKLLADMEQLADWQVEVLSTPDAMGQISVYRAASELQAALEQLGNPKAEKLKAAMNLLSDDEKNKLEVLKSSPAYANDETPPSLTFRYAELSDSMLTKTRIKFNLDSIAGNGDDISRIKNILYWVHDNIRHDGNNYPPGPATLSNILESAQRNNCGYNCRALAICLAEALLAVGIPSRYLSCMPHAWRFDRDSHVINVAWSESLNKWIWVDPSFAAFVTDENGLLLHPGEVRYHLQHDLPLVLNEDANWNHETKQTKEHYLEEYMAKNLYFIETNTFQQAEPEGISSHEQGQRVVLVPVGTEAPYDYIPTSNEDWFWQAPQR